MSSKWFAHRRVRSRPRTPLTQAETQPSQFAESVLPSSPRPSKSGAKAPRCTSSAFRRKTHVVVTSRKDDKVPKTVITINQVLCKKPSSVAKTSPACSVTKVESQQIRTPSGVASLSLSSLDSSSSPSYDYFPAFGCDEPCVGSIETGSSNGSIYEDAMESFGIELPASPSSTLNESKLHREDSVPTLSPHLYETNSMSTADTVVDDGLSPWGLPKLLDTIDDDDDESDELASADLPSSQPISRAIVPQVFQNAPAKISAQQKDSNMKFDTSKLSTVIYLAKVIVLHRKAKSCQHYSHILETQRLQVEKESRTKQFTVPWFGYWV